MFYGNNRTGKNNSISLHSLCFQNKVVRSCGQYCTQDVHPLNRRSCILNWWRGGGISMMAVVCWEMQWIMFPYFLCIVIVFWNVELSYVLYVIINSTLGRNLGLVVLNKSMLTLSLSRMIKPWFNLYLLSFFWYSGRWFSLSHSR